MDIDCDLFLFFRFLGLVLNFKFYGDGFGNEWKVKVFCCC